MSAQDGNGNTFLGLQQRDNAVMKPVIRLTLTMVVSLGFFSVTQLVIAAPNVVWELTASSQQVGYSHGNSPTIGPFTFVKSLDNGSGGYTAGALSGNWDLPWVGGSNLNDPGDTASGGVSGYFSAGVLETSMFVNTGWSDHYLIVGTRSDLSATAWVRGAGGTTVDVERVANGIWRYHARYPTISSITNNAELRAFGTTQSLSGSSATEIQISFDDSSTMTTTGTSRFFDEYPGIPYSRLNLQSVASLTTNFGRTCILFCGPEHQHVGGGELNLSITITVPGQAERGDYDGNGSIGPEDYDLWTATFGLTTGDLRADGNGNGIVDAADYVVWRKHLPAQASSLESRSVPEPTAVWLSLGALAILASQTARKR